MSETAMRTAAVQLARIVLSLNPKAGELGEGMARNMQSLAARVVGEADPCPRTADMLEKREHRSARLTEGVEAFKAGRPARDNPYERGTVERRDWSDGHDMARMGLA